MRTFVRSLTVQIVHISNHYICPPHLFDTKSVVLISGGQIS